MRALSFWSSTNRFFLAWVATCSIGVFACGDDADGTSTDQGDGDGDLGGRDRAGLDGGTDDDSGGQGMDRPVGDTGGVDLGVADADGGIGADTDAGTVGSASWQPGSHVAVAEGRVQIGATLAQVRAALPGVPEVRSTGMGANMPRSYEYTVSGGLVLTVWFSNVNLDASPTIESSDPVLWVAVSSGFAGRDSNNLGIGSARSGVTTAYGAAPKSTPITSDPMGTLDSYFVRGMLIAYDPANLVRTITVTKTYGVEPNATIDINNGTLAWPSRTLISDRFAGSASSDITQLIGPEDGMGPATFGAVTLDTLAYAFFGAEFFVFPALDSLVFMSVHAPFFGRVTGTTLGIGSPRADVETYLTAQGFGAAQVTTTNPNVLCYEDAAATKAVGVTYSMTLPGNPLTTLVLGLPPDNCP